MTVKFVPESATTLSGAKEGTVLRAFGARTGRNLWKPVDLGGRYWWSALTLVQGKIFALNFIGKLTALSAATGQRIWRTNLVGQLVFRAPPTYRDGVVYAGGAGAGGTSYAVDAATGRFICRHTVANGNHAAPAVTAADVYLCLADDKAHRFIRSTGAARWTRNPHCTSCGMTTPVVAAGFLWVRGQSASSVRLSDGKVLQTVEMNGPNPPAFLERTAFFVTGGSLLPGRSTTSAR